MSILTDIGTKIGTEINKKSDKISTYTKDEIDGMSFSGKFLKVEQHIFPTDIARTDTSAAAQMIGSVDFTKTSINSQLMIYLEARFRHIGSYFRPNVTVYVDGVSAGSLGVYEQISGDFLGIGSSSNVTLTKTSIIESLNETENIQIKLLDGTGGSVNFILLDAKIIITEIGA